MIIKDGTNANIEKHKQKLGLTGDVYLVNDHFMESLASHRRLFPDSTATTIEDAMAERIAYEAEQDEQERITARTAEEGESDEEAQEE